MTVEELKEVRRVLVEAREAVRAGWLHRGRWVEGVPDEERRSIHEKVVRSYG